MLTRRRVALLTMVPAAFATIAIVHAQPPTRVPARPDQWIWPDVPDDGPGWHAHRDTFHAPPAALVVTPAKRPAETYLGWMRPGQVCRLGPDLLLVVRGDRHPHDADSPRAGWKMPDDKGWVWVVRLAGRNEEPHVRRLLGETVVRPVARCEIVVDEGNP